MLITLRNNLSEIERLASTVMQFGRENNFSDKVIFDLNLALEEVVNNIISYGYQDKNEHQINIHMELEGAELELRVEDDGIPFNPLEVPEPDINKPIEERQPGGLGLFFVRNLTDKLEYRRVKDKNIFIMRKKTQDR
ncbi:MAG: ATP-binding protein [Candidatus Aminicenantes bacterium]|nr:ATP-binding protein [Candidatus Aminicenantes bacterium]MDH5705768.1 ATP-binding protein [Candidatus Aminicenantes bacterium]